MNNPQLSWSFDLQSTPATLCGGEVIFVAANSVDAKRATLQAFTLDGRELWSRTFEQVLINGIETLEVWKTPRVFVSLSSANLLYMVLAHRTSCVCGGHKTPAQTFTANY